MKYLRVKRVGVEGSEPGEKGTPLSWNKYDDDLQSFFSSKYFFEKKNHIMWKKSFFEIIYLVDLIILRMWRKCPCADQFVKERKIFIFDLHVRPDHQ